MKWFLIIIILLASFLRVYRIESVPPSPSLDEVSIGWNAYSLLKTGKDEYGISYPLILRAYDDYRPALYVYLVIPMIAIFGLTAEAVRFPSVILSVFTVLSTYYLVKQISKNQYVGIFAAFLLAISPWHIYISRLGHEANLGLSAGIFAITFFFTAIYSKKQQWLLFISGMLFVIALYGYQSQKIIIPIILLSLGVIFYKELLKIKKITLLTIIISVVLLIPLVRGTFFGPGLARFAGTSVLNEANPYFESAKKEFVKGKQEHDLFKQIFNYPRFTSERIILEQYLTHFSPTWLFSGKAEESHKVPYMGLLYLWEAPFILIGIYALYRTISRRLYIFLLIWFLSSPIPAAITTQAPHAMRAYTFLPLWQILGASGLWYFFNKLSVRSLKIGFSMVLSLVILSSLGTFFHNYFSIFPTNQSESFSYATKDIMPFVIKHKREYKKIVVSSVLGDQFAYPSYMFFLFYTHFDPAKYQNQGGTKSGSFSATHTFDNFEFRTIQSDERELNVLYITTYTEPSGGKHVQYVGTYKDAKPGVIAYTYD